MICQICGQKNPDTIHFCQNCGINLTLGDRGAEIIFRIFYTSLDKDIYVMLENVSPKEFKTIQEAFDFFMRDIDRSNIQRVAYYIGSLYTASLHPTNMQILTFREIIWDGTKYILGKNSGPKEILITKNK